MPAATVLHPARFLRRFVDANSRLSARVHRRADAAFYARYDDEVVAAIRRLAPGAVVVDIGGGCDTAFAGRLDRDQDVRIVAVDISAEELAANTAADETRVGDVTKRIPFADGEVSCREPCSSTCRTSRRRRVRWPAC
jgi:ubiquinone/menaquinone biosynthesis C-methylase UbiE